MTIFADKILRKNISFLLILQIANYIFPLLVVPYLGTTLGAENFGKISFAQAFIAYFALFVDFGFNVTATKEIASEQTNKKKLSIIFWNTIFAKVILSVISFVIFFIIIVSFQKFRDDILLYSISFLQIISSLFLPLWLFQGLEKMGLVTIINTIPRFLMLFLIFFLVKDPQDFHLALLIQVITPLISSIISLLLVSKLKLINYVKPNFRIAKSYIIDSWPVFASSLSSNIYTTTNTVILGLLSNNTIVGIYTGADKIVRALIALLSSITQVIFPRMNVYLKESKFKAISFIKKIISIMVIICIIIGVIFYFYSDLIISLLFKNNDFIGSATVLRYSPLLILLSIVNGLIAINIFITFDLKKELMKIVFGAGIFSLIIIAPLVYFYKELGPVICSTVTELTIFILFFVVIKFKKNIFS